MYCGNCGAGNPDGSTFCKQCGAKLGGAKPVSPVNPARKPVSNSGNQNRTVGIIAISAVAVVLLLVVGILLFGGRSYKSTVKQFVSAINNADGKKLLSLVPDEVVDAAIDDDDDFDDRDDLIKYFNKNLKHLKNELDDEFDEGWKITYEILDTDEITGKSLRSFKEEYEDEYDCKVTAAMEVEVELTLKYGKEEETDSVYLYLIKVGNSWCLDVEIFATFVAKAAPAPIPAETAPFPTEAPLPPIPEDAAP